jgi:hypothetical protein
VLKGTHFFLSVGDVKAKTTEILNSFPESDLQNCLKVGSIVCSCESTQKGTILKEILVDFLNLLNKERHRHSLVFFLWLNTYMYEFMCLSLESEWFVRFCSYSVTKELFIIGQCPMNMKTLAPEDGPLQHTRVKNGFLQKAITILITFK